MKKYLLSGILLILTGFYMHAQYNYFSFTDTVSHSDFYKIKLSPEICSFLKNDYSDIRILDADKHEIPYLLKKENLSNSNINLFTFSIINQSITSKNSTLIFENSKKIVLVNVAILVKNTQANKILTLKGSDDLKNWYFISNQIPEKSNGNNLTESWYLSFPASNYRYFEISTSNKTDGPINIISVNYPDYHVDKGGFTSLPQPVIEQTDSNKRSYFRIIFNYKYRINRLEFVISKPHFFLRNCRLESIGKTNVYDAYSLQLESDKKLKFETENIQSDTLQLVVDNEDNPPLQIDEIKAFQLNTYLIAALDSGKRYKVIFGNSQALSPGYDLKYFQNKIPSNLVELKTYEIKTITKTGNNNNSGETSYKSLIMWIIIGIVGAILVLISIKILKEKEG